jgi:uncharacterized protein YhdP
VRADASGKLGDQYYLLASVDSENKLRASLGIGASTNLPQDGFALHMANNELNLDTWVEFLGTTKSSHKTAEVKKPDTPESTVQVTAQIKKLIAFGREWNDFNLNSNEKNGVWQLRLNAPQIAGQIQWHPSNPIR